MLQMLLLSGPALMSLTLYAFVHAPLGCQQMAGYNQSLALGNRMQLNLSAGTTNY